MERKWLVEFDKQCLSRSLDGRYWSGALLASNPETNIYVWTSADTVDAIGDEVINFINDILASQQLIRNSVAKSAFSKSLIFAELGCTSVSALEKILILGVITVYSAGNAVLSYVGPGQFRYAGMNYGVTARLSTLDKLDEVYVESYA